MNTYLLLQLCIILHLAGLALMAGTTTVEFLLFRHLSRQPDDQLETTVRLTKLLGKLAILMITGAALLVLSGAGFLLINSGFLHQLWLQCKLALVLALIVNGFVVGGRLEKQLHQLLASALPPHQSEIRAVLKKISRFYLSQLCLFVVIVVLAVFKFS